MQRSIVVRAPVALVFAVVADPDLAAKHVPNILAIRDRSPGPVGVGSTWHQVMRVAGHTLEGRVQVVEYRPPQCCSIEMQGAAGMRARITMDLEPHAEGTLVRQTFDYHVPGGLVGAMAARLFFDRMAERDIEENQRILKRVVEDLAAGQGTPE
ncbi:MAG: SRPBCC family protein [Chloroflexi bacterium]|nr:SRPBCC family protein [Chloroflexota bacterium]